MSDRHFVLIAIERHEHWNYPGEVKPYFYDKKKKNALNIYMIAFKIHSLSAFFSPIFIWKVQNNQDGLDKRKIVEGSSEEHKKGGFFEGRFISCMNQP